MRQFFMLLALFLLCGPLPAEPNPNPHPDPDRPRIYTYNYHWQPQPELAEKLMQSSGLKQRPEVEELTGCMMALHYLVIPAADNAETGLDLSCFNGLARNDLVVIAREKLNITAFASAPPSKHGWGEIGRSAIEKRILPGKEPFTVRVSAQIQDPYFSFYNCSSRELLAFPVQEKVKSLQLSFHPSDAAFDWKILERFPNATRLEISGADRFLNSGTAKRNLNALMLHGCRGIDLPPLKLFQLEIDRCEFRPELLKNLDSTDLMSVELKDLDLADFSFLNSFTSCSQLTIANCPNLTGIAPVAKLKHLFSLTLLNNRIEDLSPLEGKERGNVHLSGADPAIDCPLGKGFAKQEFARYTIVHPKKIEKDGYRWQLEIGGKRIGNTFFPEQAELVREDYLPPWRFRLDIRSGQRDYPPMDQVQFIFLPRETDKQYSITIAGTQRFTDFIRLDRNQVTLNCAEGKLSGTL